MPREEPQEPKSIDDWWIHRRSLLWMKNWKIKKMPRDGTIGSKINEAPLERKERSY